MTLSNTLIPALLITLACHGADFEWRRTTPAKVGFDSAKLNTLVEDLSRRSTSAFLVVRHGEIVCEWYAPGVGPDKPQGTASLAKATIGGMSLLAAMDLGLISPDDLASKYIPAWKGDPRKSRITIRHLATHTSGLEDAEQDETPHDKLPGWKGAFWRRNPDPFSIALRQAPVLFEPGTRQAYSNPGMAALAYAVTASLKGSPYPDIKTLLDERVMKPLGIGASEWSIGYGQAYHVDGLSLYANWGGAAFTARAAAKLGMLLLARGEWNGRQVIARGSVERSLRLSFAKEFQDPHSRPSGLAFWLNLDGAWDGLPKDAFAGSGAGHKVLMVAPSLDLIMFRGGQDLDPQGADSSNWPTLVEYIYRPLMNAIIEK